MLGNGWRLFVRIERLYLNWELGQLSVSVLLFMENV